MLDIFIFYFLIVFVGFFAMPYDNTDVTEKNGFLVSGKFERPKMVKLFLFAAFAGFMRRYFQIGYDPYLLLHHRSSELRRY